MTPVRVFIATTEGLVQVQSIREDTPGVRPVVCLDGSFSEVGISAVYAKFVKRPTGVIEVLTHHDAYRVDVDKPIDSGESWQLGMYTAHLLQSLDQLAGPADAVDEVIIATGVMASDLTVKMVRHGPTKLSHIATFLAENPDTKVTVLFPTGNDPDLASDAGKTIAAAQKARIFSLQSAKELPRLIPALAQAAGAEDEERPLESQSTSEADTEGFSADDTGRQSQALNGATEEREFSPGRSNKRAGRRWILGGMALLAVSVGALALYGSDFLTPYLDPDSSTTPLDPPPSNEQPDKKQVSLDTGPEPEIEPKTKPGEAQTPPPVLDLVGRLILTDRNGSCRGLRFRSEDQQIQFVDSLSQRDYQIEPARKVCEITGDIKNTSGGAQSSQFLALAFPRSGRPQVLSQERLALPASGESQVQFDVPDQKMDLGQIMLLAMTDSGPATKALDLLRSGDVPAFKAGIRDAGAQVITLTFAP